MKPRIHTLPARELEQRIVGFGDHGDEIYLQQEKLESCGSEFVESILQHGIKTPICLTTTQKGLFLLNGHHRFFLALSLDLDIPYVVESPSLDFSGQAFSMSLGREYPGSWR